MADYNGWANRSTWNIMLWLDNDYGMYQAYRERVRSLKARNLRITGVRAREIALDVIGDKTPDGISLHNKAVKWSEIAEAMKEE